MSMEACAEPQTPWRDITVSNRLIIELVRAVERSGVPRETFLRTARIEPVWLEPVDSRVRLADLFDASEVALRVTKDPAFGLHWAEGLAANAFSVVSHLVTHAPTLYQAFEILMQFGELVSDHLWFELVEDTDHAILRSFDTSGHPMAFRRLAAEMMMLGLLRLMQQYVGRRVPQIRVCFQYPAPAYRAEYRRVFEGAERFGQPFTGLVFPRELLRASPLQKDEDLYAALVDVAERRLVRLHGRTSYSVRCRDLLLQEPAPHRATMPRIARRLGLSVRSLHRRLTEEGHSYASLAHEASAKLAKCLLINERRTIQETAHAMGFSSASSFHRAFRRWTGTTPSAFRAER